MKKFIAISALSFTMIASSTAFAQDSTYTTSTTTVQQGGNAVAVTSDPAVPAPEGTSTKRVERDYTDAYGNQTKVVTDHTTDASGKQTTSHYEESTNGQ